MVEDCKSQAAAWAGLDADARPGWKGCWTRAMTPGCGVSASGSCVLKAEGGGIFFKNIFKPHEIEKMGGLNIVVEHTPVF